MKGCFFTKLNQGALYRNFRDIIIGVVDQPDPGPGKYKTSKKKVGYNINSKSMFNPLTKHGIRSVLEQVIS